MTKLTIEELKALLEHAYKFGKIEGQYAGSSVGYRELIGVKTIYFSFEDFYKKEIEGKNKTA